ncbi:MAG TPA: hypothetical protein VJ783_31040 [Pirellulales bacterium]|nr:hypothetical protein [Pirellulales bacterium]
MPRPQFSLKTLLCLMAVAWAYLAVLKRDGDPYPLDPVIVVVTVGLTAWVIKGLAASDRS